MLDLIFDIYTLSVIVFVALLALFFWFDRKNVQRQSVLLLRKTTKGKAFLTNLGRRFPRGWWVYGNLAVVVGFAASVFISIFLLSMVSEALTAETAAPLALVLPSPTSETIAVPGVMGVPFWYWIISIFALILVHEGSHGIMAAREKVRIKTLGWGAFLIIPLAFVEPDEKQLQKERPMKQLRVFAAGSFGNFVLAGVVLLVIAYSTPALFEPSGAGFTSLIEGYPAQGANLTGTITRIGGYDISSPADLSAALDEMGPGRAVSITTMVRTENGLEARFFSLTTAERPDNEPGGFIGIAPVYQDYTLREGTGDPEVIRFLFGSSPNFMGLFTFLFIINFGVGLFNLLPIGPLDGGRMWRILLEKFAPRHSKAIMNGVTWVFFLVVVLLFASAFI